MTPFDHVLLIAFNGKRNLDIPGGKDRVLPKEPVKRMSYFRSRVETLLRSREAMNQVNEWADLAPRQLVNHILSFLFHPDELVKWRAVTLLGLVVNRMAEEDLESARNFMRRLMWSLNDESGGIGWGSAETMGEIMALNETLAREYGCILLSYARADCNPLENALLERGVLWGIGRLAQARPELVKESGTYLLPYLSSSDPIHRGYTLWILSFLRADPPPEVPDSLLLDTSSMNLYENETLSSWRICDLAQRLRERLPGKKEN